MKHQFSYVGIIDNDSCLIKTVRRVLFESGFRLVLRGRGPRGKVLKHCGPYTARSDFPLWLNPPKVAVYLRHAEKSWTPGCNDRMPEVKAKLVQAFPHLFGTVVEPVKPVVTPPLAVKEPVLPKVGQFHVFNVTLSELVANAISSSSDMVSDFRCDSDEEDFAGAQMNWSVVKNVVDDLLTGNRDKIAKHFNDGFTMLMLPHGVMTKIEQLNIDDKDAKFYIEVFVPGSKTPHVIHSDEVEW